MTERTLRDVVVEALENARENGDWDEIVGYTDSYLAHDLWDCVGDPLMMAESTPEEVEEIVRALRAEGILR